MTSKASDTSSPIAGQIRAQRIIGTAGHIDHGKTSLVLALTGTNTDRLPVEQQRGITTELGFAHTELTIGADRIPVAVIDVPGHERFVHAMVAGAGGIDVACLVVAADEGMKPQTREHLDVCRLLGVARMVVALNKADVVSEEKLADVTQLVRSELAATPFRDAAIVPVSARTLSGIPQLRSALAAAIDSLPSRDSAHLGRLPIDRVFSIKGTGTVVTGTLRGGDLHVGDEWQLCPSNRKVRVRGIQQHGKAVSQGSVGQRLAVNLTASNGTLGVEDVSRGETLHHPAAAPGKIIDATFEYVAAAKKTLQRTTAVVLHHGTAAVPGKMELLDPPTLAPGETGRVQIRLATPLVVLPHDRFIVRGSAVIANFGRTLGGGMAIRPLAPKAKRKSRSIAAFASLQEGDAASRLQVELEAAGFAGCTLDECVAKVGLDNSIVAAKLDALCKAGSAVKLGACFVERSKFDEVCRRVLSRVTPQGAPLDECRSMLTRLGMATSTTEGLFAQLTSRGLVEIRGTAVYLPGQKKPAALSPFEQSVLRELDRTGLLAPNPKDLAATLRATAPAVSAALATLAKQQLAVRVKPDYYVITREIDRLHAALRTFFATTSRLTPTVWKELTGVSRKYAIPLIEYFDEIKLTLRVGDERKLR